MKLKRLFSGCVIAGLIVSTGIAEEVMWGFTPDRNLVSGRKKFADELECRNGRKYRLESRSRFAVLRRSHQDWWKNIHGDK